MEIAFDFAKEMKEADATLWRDYTEGMFGARMLTWSRRLRKRFQLGKEATDKELVDDQKNAAIVCRLLDAQEWARVRDVPLARAKILEDVELSPGEAVLPL